KTVPSIDLKKRPRLRRLRLHRGSKPMLPLKITHAWRAPVKSSVKSSVKKLNLYKNGVLRRGRYEPKVSVYFEYKNFIVKTCESELELLKALMLRYEVFHKEYRGKRLPWGIDQDDFDDLC